MAVKNKILFISPHAFSFKDSGGGAEQRTALLLKACVEIANVDIVMFYKEDSYNIPKNCKIIYAKPLKEPVNKNFRRYHKWCFLIRFWDIYAFFPKNREKSNVVKSIINKGSYDFIVTRYISRACEAGLISYTNKLILDVDDSPVDVFAMMSKNSKSLMGKLRYFLMSNLSTIHLKSLSKRINHLFFPNPKLAQYYGKTYLPNIPFYENEVSKPVSFLNTNKRLLFVGTLGYKPNLTGVDYFINNVFTSLQKKINDVELVIVGRFTKEFIVKDWIANSNVRVKGFVEDLQQEYENSRVVVVPIYQGSGTNIKVLEALQMKRACVLTEFATRGFGDIFENKKDYFVAYSDDEFVDILESLLTDEYINTTTALNGYNKLIDNFSFKKFSKIVRETILN